MDRTTLLWAALLAALAVTACSRSASAELKTLTVEQVAAKVAAHDGKTFVYDDNPKDRYVKGHIPGARWVESGDVTAAILATDKTSTLVFYCASEL